MKTFRRPTVRAFTLLELLVVISIIAVLAGILLPVATGVMDKAKKVDARVTMTNVVTAIKSYQTEYGQYPAEPPAAGADATSAKDTSFDAGEPNPADGKGGHNGVLLDVLRALNNPSGGGSTGSSSSTAYKALNSRRIVYFESKDVKNVTDPRNGFISPPSTSGTPQTVKEGYKVGDLVDPWGNLFCFRVDSNYSDAIVQPYPVHGDIKGVNYDGDTTDNDQTGLDRILRTPIVGWCAGKDKIFGDANGKLVASCDDVVTWQN